jgi:leader peptidase (prepilin peptidase)/N-methyltransferase
MINLSLMIIIGIMLFGAGIVDIRSLKVSRAFIIVLFLACMAAFATSENPNVISALAGASIGLCAIGISFAAGEQIGRGDGLVIMAIGIIAGFRWCLAVVCIASVVMSIVAIVMLVLKKGNKKTKLPFIPALFVGYIIFVASTTSLIGGIYV